MSNIELLRKMDLLAPPEEGISQVGGVFKSVAEAMAFMAKMNAGTRGATTEPLPADAENAGTKRKRAEKLSDGEELELAEGVKVMAERGGEFIEAEIVKESKKPGFWALRFDDGKLLPRSPAQMKSPFKKRPADDSDDAGASVKNDSAKILQPGETMRIRIRRRKQ
jgi:hypothetical protein